MEATGTHKVETEARAGVKSTDGIAITPVVALTFTNHTTKVTLGTDDNYKETAEAGYSTRPERLWVSDTPNLDIASR